MAKCDPYDLLPEGVAAKWRRANTTVVPGTSRSDHHSIKRDWGAVEITIYVHLGKLWNHTVYFDFEYHQGEYNILADFRQPNEAKMVIQLLNKLSASRETGYDLMHYLKLQKLWENIPHE